MTPRSFLLSDEIHRYVVAHCTPLGAVDRALVEETAALGPIAGMQIAPEQGAFMTMLTRLLGATQAVEVGTFTGYSALCIARGLAPGGRLLTCDIDDQWAPIARRHWEAAGVAHRIELRVGPALDTLRSLSRGTAFDLAFIDADKASYVAYFEELVGRMRPGGLILVDNVLWGGRVVDPASDDDDTVAIRRFNDAVAADSRVESVMLPVADGLTLLHVR